MKKIARALACVFAALELSACGGSSSDEIVIYMPDGAPALALANLMHEDVENDGITYRVVAPTVIQSVVNYEDTDKNADICVLPVTAASKLLGSGEAYQMLGVVTQGNLYLVSATETTYHKENLSDLVGKTVAVAQMNEVPGLTLKAVLNAAEVAWTVTGADTEFDESKVNLSVASGEIELLAEPAVSKKTASGVLKIVGDMQALYGDGQGYPQAVLVAKTSLINSREEWLRSFISKVQNGGAWLQQASAEEIYGAVTSHFEDEAKTPVFSAETLSNATIARCGIKYAPASDCRAFVEEYLRAMRGVNENAAVIPDESFYWRG